MHAKLKTQEIDAEAAREDGLKFYIATGKVYVCAAISPKYIRRAL